jgi:membrane protein implicated in regulation of membrane protease activity
MVAFLEQFEGLEKLFMISAVAGGVLFVIRLVMQFLGGDTGAHHDMGAPVDVGGGDIHGDTVADSSDAYLSFKLLSFQGLTAFFMMFGLVGLAMMRQTDRQEILSLVVAVAAGLATVWLISFIFRKAGGLQSSGNIDMKNAVGQQGEVYLGIPAAGIGKARITVQDRLRIYDAVSKDKTEIKTGQRVRVLEVTPQDVLVVERME